MKIERRDYVKHPLTTAEIDKMCRDGKRDCEARLRELSRLMKMKPPKGWEGMRIG